MFIDGKPAACMIPFANMAEVETDRLLIWLWGILGGVPAHPALDFYIILTFTSTA